MAGKTLDENFHAAGKTRHVQPPAKSAKLVLALGSLELGALDVWIADQPPEASREAVSVAC